jgi:hypothetical protein
MQAGLLMLLDFRVIVNVTFIVPVKVVNDSGSTALSLA